MKPILSPIVRTLSLSAACLALAASFVRAETPKLNIGDSAPVLQPAKWLKGTPIPKFAKGKVYVVEFWATWCGPCKANIPHLTEMAKRYKGKVDIVGVDIWESSDPAVKTLPKVEKFVKAQGARMNYHVVADTNRNRVANAWMKASGEEGLPIAFIVGKDGRIAYIGNPAVGFESVLKQVVADKFDVAAARARREQQLGPMQAIQAAIDAKSWATALKRIDAEIVRNPNSEARFEYTRLSILAHSSLPTFQKRARNILTQTKGDAGIYQMLCSIFASSKDLSPEAYQFGRSLIDEALLKKEREYLFFAMASEIDSSLGDKSSAVRSQTAAVKAAETDSHCPPEFLQMLRNKLEKLQTTAGA